MPFLRLLLENEAGIKVDGCNDSDLKPAFEQNRKKLFVHDPADKGGATLCGVTHKTFVAATKDHDYDHFLKMSYERWSWICTRQYWDKLRCSEMDSLPIALMVADFAFNSGVQQASKSLQSALNSFNIMLDFQLGKPLYEDGVIGNKTLAMIQTLNKSAQSALVMSQHYMRRLFIQAAVKNGGINKKFENGLLKRVERTTAYALKYLFDSARQ